MNIQTIFKYMTVDGDECETCLYNHETRDAYGTGDSPSIFECRGEAECCEMAKRKLKEWLEDMNEIDD